MEGKAETIARVAPRSATNVALAMCGRTAWEMARAISAYRADIISETGGSDHRMSAALHRPSDCNGRNAVATPESKVGIASDAIDAFSFASCFAASPRSP